jgi:small subunit ribosomal protein S20
MANHKSAIKRMRQTDRKNEVNSRNRGTLRTQIKKLRTAVDTGDSASAKNILNETVSVIDKSVQKGVLHKNAAARHKSRLTATVGKMSA